MKLTQVSRDAVDREQLVVRHLGLVHHIARRIARTAAPGVEVADLVSAGTIGLLQAIDSYDRTYNLAFSTFAAPRIRGAILDDLRRSDHASRTTRRRQRDVQRVERNLASKLARGPRHEEIAQELGVSTETLWSWKGSGGEAVHVSWQDPGGARVLESAVTGSADEIEAPVERAQQLRWLTARIAALPDRERKVLALYYVQELNLREIAAVLGVTESRVSQIRSAALSKLREQWRAETAA